MRRQVGLLDGEIEKSCLDGILQQTLLLLLLLCF